MSLNSGLAARALATKFGCGRSQINWNNESIIELYESNIMYV